MSSSEASAIFKRLDKAGIVERFHQKTGLFTLRRMVTAIASI